MAGVLLLSSLFVTASFSQASKPFFSFCTKITPAGANAHPDIYSLPTSSGGCAKGLTNFTASSPADVISVLNTISKSEFQKGWSLGNYQTSVQDQSQPCIPGQPGCGH